MICIIGSETTKNYGLFTDIEHSHDCKIVYATPPFLYGTIFCRVIRRARKRVHNTNKIQIPPVWERSIIKNLGHFEHIIVIDTALRWINPDFLNKCKEIKPELLIDCLLLNSTKSWTFSEHRIHSTFNSFNWSNILTFDPHDAKTNNWIYTGLYYYSKYTLKPPRKQDADLFFAGSCKGQRGKILLQLLACFNKNDIDCQFWCPSLNKRHYLSDWFNRAPGLHLMWKRVSYKRILQKMMNCNCILEVLQEGQEGSSLRYFEAVCYNKKLLTTNPDIINYPFYDDRFMKVFVNESDIDYDWIKKTEHIDYGYNSEFSPIHLLSKLPLE